MDFPKTAFNITTSASASQISMPGHQKGILSQQQIETTAKMRSASVDGGNTVDQRILLEQGYDDENNDENSRRQSSPLLSDSESGGCGVITASLKIPVPSGSSGTSFALNLDDADIPYIEDGGGGGFSITTEGGRQHMTIGK
jgi:hypothetical protein